MKFTTMMLRLQALIALTLFPSLSLAEDGTTPFETRTYGPLCDAYEELSISEIREDLEAAGINFSPQAQIVYWRSSRTLFVKASEESLKLLDSYFASLTPGPEPEMKVILEYVEVEGQDYFDWIYKNRIDSNANALREQVQFWIEKKRAEVTDILSVGVRSGPRARATSGKELIYGTEVTVPEIPNLLNLEGRNTVAISPPTFTAFETRKVGTNFELDPVLGVDGVTVDLNIAPERVALRDDSSWPSEEIDPHFQIKMPTFIAEKLTTQLTTLDGDYTLVGSYRPDHNTPTDRDQPMIVVFVRADVMGSEKAVSP